VSSPTDVARRNALQANAPPGGALLAVDPANVAFATGIASMADTIYRDPPFWAVVSADGVQIVVAAMEVPAVAERMDVALLQPYGTFPLAGAGSLAPLLTTGRSLAGAVVDALGALDVSGELVADPALPSAAAEAIRALLGADRLELDGAPFDHARARKDDEALACLERANHLAETAIEEALDGAHVGTTESELAMRVQERILAGGGRPMLHVVAIGERSALPEPWPSDRALAQGDGIRFDIGCTVDGWHADLARTAVCGEPSEWLSDAHSAILAGQDAALAAIRPGVAVADLFERAVGSTRRAGLPEFERVHCGHGIGLSVYEGFVVRPSDPAALEERNVLCVETPHYDLAQGGVQIEDAVVVTADGFRRLGALRRELLQLPCVADLRG
jgi:Xaa-Pro aminopeptidase